jgi:hypothetical protein
MPVRERKMSVSEFASPGSSKVESDMKMIKRPSAEMEG